MLFRSSTQYISGLGQSYWDFMNNTGVFTVSCWVKNDVATPASQQTIVSTNYDSVQTGWGLYYNTSFGTRFDLTKATSGVFSASTNDGVTTGRNAWRQITVTGDGTNLRMFINGVLVDTTAFTGFSGATQNVEMTIGSYIGTALPYDGRIDDVRIFDRTLTPAETTHLAEARGIQGPPPVGLGDEQLWLCPSINDSANDISGNGNNGTYNGGMGTVTSDGKLAYDFDGTDDYISTAFAPSTSSHDFVSYSAWINIANQSSAAFPILTDRNNSTVSGWVNFAVRVDSSSLKHAAYVPNSFYDLPLPQSSGSWVHLVQTRDKASKQLTVYANGVLVGTSTYTGSDTFRASTFSLGKWDDGGSGGGAALLDDVRYFERALTAAEITHLATSRGIEGGPSTPPTTGFYNPFINMIFNNDYTRRIR